MTDRELLELAAKAAGMDAELTWTPGATPWLRVSPELSRPWNPLHDDGDALRLAVKLDMCVCLEKRYGLIYATVDGWRVGMEPEEPFGDDKFAATRRAITRAAAEIGRKS